MPISITCECGKKLTVKDELAGKRVRCPACQAILTVTAAKAAVAAAPKPKAAVGAPPKNGEAAARTPTPTPSSPVEENGERQDQELDDKPAGRTAARPNQDERPKKKLPKIDDDEQIELDDEELTPKKAKAGIEEDQTDDEPPVKKKPKIEEDGEDEELFAKKKPVRKPIVEDEEEEEEVQPKGKKAKIEERSKKAAKVEEEEQAEDEEEEEAPKKAKGKDKGKGKGKPEVPPAMLQFSKFIVKTKTKGGKKTIEILDADSNEMVATVRNATGFLGKLGGSVVYEIKDQETGKRAFSVGRTGFLSKKERVNDARGKVVATFKWKKTSLASGFQILDKKGKQLCEVQGKLPRSEYRFLNADDEEIGSVSKDWGDDFNLSGAGTFGVQIEPDFAEDDQMKMIVLGAALAVETILPMKKVSKAADEEDGEEE